MVLPILIGAFGLTLGIIFIISVISRLCFKCCRFEPDRDEVTGMTKRALREWTNTHIRRRDKQKFYFFLFFVASMLTVHVAYVGNSYLSEGFKDAVDSIDAVSDTFDSLEVSRKYLLLLPIYRLIYMYLFIRLSMYAVRLRAQC